MIIFRVKGGGKRRPLARIGNDHQCPQHHHDGTAHQGGPIYTGSGVLKDQGNGVARVGDKLHCEGATDTIVEGIDNLLIDGRPAAVEGSQCAHGALVVEGCSNIFVEEYDPQPIQAGYHQSCAAMGITPQTHWIQGQYLDGQGKGMVGMPYRIVHEDGYTMCGTLDQNGLTERMPNMAQGTATIYFGDRPGLEQQLQRQREQLKHYLNNIIAKTTAYAKAHPDNTADMNWAQRSFKVSFR